MGIFDKLFGKLGNVDITVSKPDIEKLISAKNLNNSIIELDNYISSLCEYGERLDLLNDHQKVFFHNQCVEREINNGGFYQFYFNSSGDNAHETVESLTQIGALKTARIVQKANEQFPDKTVPKDSIERQRVLEQIEDRSRGAWEQLDQDFCAYEEDLNTLNMQHIRAHLESFR